MVYIKGIFGVLFLLSLPLLVWWSFTVPVVAGPTTIGGAFIGYFLVDMVFGRPKA